MESNATSFSLDTVASRLEVWGIQPLTLLLILPVTTVIFWSIGSQATSPLNKYPGPLLARWTNIWRLWQVTRGDSHLRWKALHEKYGPVVRIGPNLLDLDIPGLVKTVYNDFDNQWLKTKFYHGSSAMVNGSIAYNIFSELDPREHARQRKPINKFYTMNGILPLEPHVNKMVDKLCSELETRFAREGKVCDLAEWLAFYAWDVIGEVTFSQSFGYLDHGYDFDGTLAISHKSIDYFSLVSQMPFLDHLLDKNRICRIGPPGFGNITDISLRHLVDRYQGRDSDYHDPAQPDFLDKFIEAKGTDGDVVNDGQIISYLMINMIAGADTTMASITTVLYLVLKHPAVQRRLEAEVRGAGLPTPPPFAAARALPYLEAVIRESQRLFCTVALTLERRVPAAGLALPDGSVVPPGTVVGMNPWVVSRTPDSVWGAAPEVFRPGRWLRNQDGGEGEGDDKNNNDDDKENGGGESEDAFRARVRAMNAADLSFGAGTRGCIGKNLAAVEMYKMLATLFARFDMRLEDPGAEWTVVNSLFLRQSGVRVVMSRRAE